MQIGLVLPFTRQHDTTDFAVRAEKLGYDSVWLGELWGENLFVQLADIAMRTNDIRIGSGIVNVYSRSPAVIAMGAKSLHRLSNGRLVLGVGVSTPKVVEDLHGYSFKKPIQRSHEAIELIKSFLSSKNSIDYEGRIFDVSDFPGLDANVPVFNAALGPANLRLTGKLCDGWLPTNIPTSSIEGAFEIITEAAHESGRSPNSIAVAPWIKVAVDDDPGVAKAGIRNVIAHSIGVSKWYENSIGTVFETESREIAAEWRSGSRTAARKKVTEEMIQELACVGSGYEVREQLLNICQNPIVDLPIIHISRGLDDEIIENTFEAVSPGKLQI